MKIPRVKVYSAISGETQYTLPLQEGYEHNWGIPPDLSAKAALSKKKWWKILKSAT